MELRKGKFWENFKEVKPEFGNLKQIQLLKAAERLYELYTTEGCVEEGRLKVVDDWCEDCEDREYEYVVDFDCTCGNKLQYKMSDCYWSEDGPDVFYEPDIHRCTDCNRVYELSSSYKNDILIKYKQ